MNRQEPIVEIIPPEGVPLRFELCSYTQRWVALLVDLGWMFLLVLLLSLLFVFFLLFFSVTTKNRMWLDSVVAFGVLSLFFVRQGYFLFFELSWQGKTPGKKFTQIQVISLDGGSLTAPSIFARNLLRDFEIFIPLTLLLNPSQIANYSMIWLNVPLAIWVFIMALFPFLNSMRMRPGDILGGTVVVKIPVAELQEDFAQRTMPKAVKFFENEDDNILFTHKQLSFYGEFELETLAVLLKQLNEGKKNMEEAKTIAITIAGKIEYEGREPFSDPSRFLRIFYASQRNFLEKKLLMGKRKEDKNSV